jgi:hypothetical protein
MIPTGIGESGYLLDACLISKVLRLSSRWLDHFDDVTLRQPGPQPKCKAPPPEGTSLPVASFANFSDRYAILELVACPRTARCV